jgi:hypothetical protein
MLLATDLKPGDLIQSKPGALVWVVLAVTPDYIEIERGDATQAQAPTHEKFARQGWRRVRGGER